MVQLTLSDCGRDGGLSQEIATLAQDWAHRLGDGAHLSTATRITEAHFAQWGSRALDSHERNRVSAYFAAVVRRGLMRANDPQAREARRRLVIASIEADLREAGWDAGRAAAEARQVTGNRLAFDGAA